MVNPDTDDARAITSIQVAMAEHAKRGLDIESLVTGVQIALDDPQAAGWIVKALASDDDTKRRLAATTKELTDRLRSILETTEQAQG